MKTRLKSIGKFDKNMRAKKVVAPEKLMWIPTDDRRLTMRGLAWFKENRGKFCRLPLRAEGKVSDSVWNLAQDPASAHVAFRSDTTALTVRLTNVSTSIMAHMAACGSNSVVLQCGEPGPDAAMGRGNGRPDVTILRAQDVWKCPQKNARVSAVSAALHGS